MTVIVSKMVLLFIILCVLYSIYVSRITIEKVYHVPKLKILKLGRSQGRSKGGGAVAPNYLQNRTGVKVQIR